MSTQTGPLADLIQRVAVLEQRAAAARPVGFRQPNQFALAKVVSRRAPDADELGSGLAAGVDFWDVIPLDFMQVDGEPPEVSERQADPIRARVGNLLILQAGDLVGLALGTDGVWWVICPMTGTGTRPNYSIYSLHGCDASVCIDADSTWATDGPPGNNCLRMPRAWVLNWPGVLNPGNCPIFWRIANAIGLQAYYEGWLLTRENAGDLDGEIFESETIECECGLQPGQNLCGTATWTWRSNVVGETSYRWQPNDPPNPFCLGNWVLHGDPCAEGDSEPPSEPPVPTEGTTLCDPQPPVAVPCINPAITPGWELTSGCDCGTASPPSYDGTEDGETATTTCDSTGYEVPTGQFRWRLSIATHKLQLIELPGRVIYEWEVPSPRAWCCLCTNTLLLSSCVKPRECIQAPMVACVEPVFVDVCPDWGEEIEVDVDGFAGEWSDAGDPFDCNILDGLYLATSPRPFECGDDTCYEWHDDMMFGAPVDLFMDGCTFVSVMAEFPGDGGVWRVQTATRFSTDGLGGRVVDVYVRAAWYTGSYVGTDYDFFVEHQFQGTGFGANDTEVTAEYTGTRGVGGPGITACPSVPAAVTVRRVA